MARVLVIDDEPNIRLTVGLALEQAGYTVEEAADGVEGLEKFGDGSAWSLVLLDQRMPALEGLEVLRYMKELDPAANVVMMTAFGSLDLALDAMEAGATDFVRKPFPLGALRSAVAAALRHHATTPADAIASSGASRFSRVTLNGFRIEPLREPARRRSGEIQQTVAVRSPSGNLTPCVVVFPPDLVERIHAEVGESDWPVDDRFWQGLAEEVLANYVWHNASVPIGAYLRPKDYANYLGRWLGAVVGSGRLA